MAVIANMDIVLGAKTGKLDTSLSQATSGVKRFAFDIGSIAAEADTVGDSLLNLAAQWSRSVPAIAGSVAVFRAVVASIVAAASLKTAATAADIAKSHKDIASETAKVATRMPVVAAEVRITAQAAERFSKALVVAAGAAQMLRLGNSGGGGAKNGLTLFNPATARAGAKSAMGGMGDVIDAEFTVLKQGAGGAIRSATGALGGLSGAAVAAGVAAGAAFAAIAAGAAAAAVVISGVRAQMTAIDDVSDAAKRLGVTFEDLASLRLGLGESSGLDQEAIDGALQRMQLGLADARGGSGELADSLKALGLDAGKLLEMGPVAALQEISTATQQLKSPTDQLQVAYQLFGRQGAALVSSLREGPGAIREAAEAAKGLGLTLSQAQAEQVGAANDTWERVYLVATGVFRQIAAEVAPVLQVIGQEILGIAGNFGAIGQFLPNLINETVRMAGGIADAWEASRLLHQVLFRIWTGDWQKIGDDIRSAFDFSTGEKWVAKVQAARDAATAAAAKPMTGEVDILAIERENEARKKAASEAEQLQRAQVDAAKRQQDAINSRIQSLKDEVNVLRLGETAARAMQLAREGASSNQIAEIQSLEQQKKAMQDYQEMLRKGADLKEQFASPMDKLRDQVAELKQLRDAGAIDAKTFNLATLDAAKKNLKIEAPKPPPAVAALQRGSVEAFSAIRQAEKDAQAQKTQEALSRQQIGILERILAQLSGTGQLATVGA